MAMRATPAKDVRFVRKVYLIVTQEPDALVSWTRDGCAFTIHDTAGFQHAIKSKYHLSSLCTFRQNLHAHGFVEVEPCANSNRSGGNNHNGDIVESSGSSTDSDDDNNKRKCSRVASTTTNTIKSEDVTGRPRDVIADTQAQLPATLRLASPSSSLETYYHPCFVRGQPELLERIAFDATLKFRCQECKRQPNASGAKCALRRREQQAADAAPASKPSSATNSSSLMVKLQMPRRSIATKRASATVSVGTNSTARTTSTSNSSNNILSLSTAFLRPPQSSLAVSPSERLSQPSQTARSAVAPSSSGSLIVRLPFGKRQSVSAASTSTSNTSSTSTTTSSNNSSTTSTSSTSSSRHRHSLHTLAPLASATRAIAPPLSFPVPAAIMNPPAERPRGETAPRGFMAAEPNGLHHRHTLMGDQQQQQQKSESSGPSTQHRTAVAVEPKVAPLLTVASHLRRQSYEPAMLELPQARAAVSIHRAVRAPLSTAAATKQLAELVLVPTIAPPMRITLTLSRSRSRHDDGRDGGGQVPTVAKRDGEQQQPIGSTRQTAAATEGVEHRVQSVASRASASKRVTASDNSQSVPQPQYQPQPEPQPVASRRCVHKSPVAAATAASASKLPALATATRAAVADNDGALRFSIKLPSRSTAIPVQHFPAARNGVATAPSVLLLSPPKTTSESNRVTESTAKAATASRGDAGKTTVDSASSVASAVLTPDAGLLSFRVNLPTRASAASSSSSRKRGGGSADADSAVEHVGSKRRRGTTAAAAADTDAIDARSPVDARAARTRTRTVTSRSRTRALPLEANADDAQSLLVRLARPKRK